MGGEPALFAHLALRRRWARRAAGARPRLFNGLPMHPEDFDRWLNRFLDEESIRAKSLLVTILGDSVAPHGGGIWLGALIALLAPFGVNERLVRTSVFRLTAEGWLEGQRHGRRSLYTLSAAGRRRIEHADRRIYGQSASSWDGRWTLVVPSEGLWKVEQRAELKRDLLWEGYAQLAQGLYGHPGAGLGPLADILSALDLQDKVAVFQGHTIAPLGCLSDPEIVRANWPLDSLAERYAAFLARFEPFLDDAAGALDPARSFQLCTLLVHAYRRVVLHDPQLPAELLPANWPGQTAFAACATIYRAACERAEAYFVERVADPGAVGSQAQPALLRRFAQAVSGPALVAPLASS